MGPERARRRTDGSIPAGTGAPGYVLSPGAEGLKLAAPLQSFEMEERKVREAGELAETRRRKKPGRLTWEGGYRTRSRLLGGYCNAEKGPRAYPKWGIFSAVAVCFDGGLGGRGAAGERPLPSRVTKPRGCPKPLHERARVMRQCRERMGRDVRTPYALRATSAKGADGGAQRRSLATPGARLCGGSSCVNPLREPDAPVGYLRRPPGLSGPFPSGRVPLASSRGWTEGG